MPSSAWEQWGAKRPANGPLSGAHGAFSNILRSSPLSSTTSTANSSSDAEGSFSLKKIWESAQDIAKSGVKHQNSELNDLESGSAIESTEQNVSPSWPFLKSQSASQSSYIPSMGWNRRFKIFIAMAVMSMIFFSMSIFFLAFVMIRPSKFALSFTLGSLCFIGAFAVLKGPSAFIVGLVQPKSILLTTAYFSTLGCTLYSCLILGSYVLVICSSLLQLVTLVAFALSSLPGGNTSLKAMMKLFWKTATTMIRSFARLFT